MTQPIRTGLLCVPALDDEALTAVGRTLRAQVPGCVVMMERQCGGAAPCPGGHPGALVQ